MRSWSSAVKPVVPTTACTPFSAAHSRLPRAASTCVKSMTTSTSSLTSAGSATIDTPSTGSPACAGSIAATNSRAGSLATAPHTVAPMRPPAPNTPTRMPLAANLPGALSRFSGLCRQPLRGRTGGFDGPGVPRQPVTFDRDSLRLTIGDRSTVVPDSAAGNEAMLRSYLALVAEVRGTPIGSGIEVRHDDVVVLAEILDLTDSGSRGASRQPVGRQRQRRR